MSQLTDIEDAILDQAEVALGATVRTYAPLPGGRESLAVVLQRNLLPTPAVCTAWGGAEQRVQVRGGVETALPGYFRGTWSVFCLVHSPVGTPTRQRGHPGTPQAIGTYAMVEALAAALESYTLSGIGTLRVMALRPLEGPALAELGVSLAEVVLQLDFDLGTGLDLTGLDDFLRFEGSIDLAPADGLAEAVAWWEREAEA